MAAVLSPFRRILVDPVVDVQRRKIALLLEYVVALTDDLDNLRNGATLTGDQVGESLDSLGAIDRQVGETMSGVESLRADSTRMMEHFAALKEGHTTVRNTVAEILAAGDAQATALNALTDDLDNLRNGATLTGDQVGELLDSLGAIDRQVGETMSGVESLRADSTRMMEHFAALQEDHTKVRNTVAEILAAGDAQATALKRIDDLWADLHRDMTALADAISRLEAD